MVHQPEPITEAKESTILWVFVIQIDWKIKSNWPDIMVKDYKRKTCLCVCEYVLAHAYAMCIGYWLEDPFDMPQKLRGWHNRKYTCFLK